MFEIVEDDLSGAATRNLLALHLNGMCASSPPGSIFALDLSGLQAPGVTLWSLRDGDLVIGIGAPRLQKFSTKDTVSARSCVQQDRVGRPSQNNLADPGSPARR